MTRLGWLLLILSLFSAATPAWAATADELRTQIGAKQTEIDKLNAQIATQEKALQQTSQQAATLQTAVKTADLTVKKLGNEVIKTETQIKQTALQLEELGDNIEDTSSNIADHELALRQMLRTVAEDNRDPLPVVLARYTHLSDFLAESERVSALEERVRQSAQELRELKTDLGAKVKATEATRQKSIKLKRELADQQKIVAAERDKQNTLFVQTKNQEANYQKMLEDTRARRDAFARELATFESQLKLVIDPSLLPSESAGILSWPVSSVFITQQFGATAAAKRLYASGTHNGIDLRASVGTPIMAAAAGTVMGTGDTDLVCKGASYGRWVLIKHDNGLATLSGHLSLIKVVAGQRVERGELIGYAGQTGYATGPHLHFTVAAAQGVEIKNLKSAVCPGTYTMPVFDARAYLDPILYLGA
jgi:murein DD-endopeptidase MepM/ murein hydrolase activator NlpD